MGAAGTVQHCSGLGEVARVGWTDACWGDPRGLVPPRQGSAWFLISWSPSLRTFL